MTAHLDSPAGLTLGARLYRERMLRNWSSEEAAAYFKISQGSYSKWETGKNKPSDEQVAKVARFLHVPERVVAWWRSGLITDDEHEGYAAVVARLEQLEAELAAQREFTERIMEKLDVLVSAQQVEVRPVGARHTGRAGHEAPSPAR